MKISSITSLALAGLVASSAFAGVAEARMRHPAKQHHVTRHHAAQVAPAATQGAYVQRQVQPGYGYGYRGYDDGFNPVAGVLGAATGIAGAGLALATAPFGGGYYGEPGYYPYGYSTTYMAPGGPALPGHDPYW